MEANLCPPCRNIEDAPDAQAGLRSDEAPRRAPRVGDQWVNIVDIFSHRNGRDILESPKFSPAFKEFMGILGGLPPYRAAEVKKTSIAHVIAPAAMNHWLDNELCVKRDWDWHPLIIDADPDDS